MHIYSTLAQFKQLGNFRYKVVSPDVKWPGARHQC